MARGERALAEPVAAALLALAWIAGMFAAAGTLRWGAGWIYLGVVGLGLAAHRAFVTRRRPELWERRSRAGPGTKPWDVIWLAIFWPLMVAAPVVAGLDTVRLGHAPLPSYALLAGGLVFGSGMAVSASAMAANPFFEGTVRLQPGQRVVETGPYRRIRHPGYAGLALWALGSPLLLRSAAAFVPALLAAAWLVLRTALEDRVLRRELTGYDDYARRVRWRWLPGVW